MKLKRRRASEVPPKIRSSINNIIAAPLDSIEEPLKTFVWDFDKGDFHHWVDLFDQFNSYFEKYINPRKDLHLEDDFVCSDPPFPREAIIQILRVIRIILENCTNKHFYSSHEQHLSSLLACTDPDIVEASLQTLATFLKKTVGKYSMRDASLNSKLFAFAQGWGGKEEGLGLTTCALENGCDSTADQLGRTLHFEFYAADESSSDLQAKQGLQIIHLSNISSHEETDLELLDRLVKEYKVPPSLRFSLLTRLRYARGFGSLASRQQLTCIRLYAFVVLVQASSDTGNLVSFFNSEPEFINELVSLLSFEDVPEKIRILSLLSLVALCQDRSRQPTVLAAVTSGGHRGILSSLMQKAIDSVLNDSSKCSVVFADTLLALVTVLVSSSSGCSTLREARFMPTLLPLLKDTNPQHLHLVTTAVHVLEAFMDYSNPAAALFRDLGGLDDTISRLQEEVSIVENGVKQMIEDSDCGRKDVDVITGRSAVPEDRQPLYSEALVSYHRRLLMKALLRAISLGTYAPGSTTRVSGPEERLLPQCLCVIFRRAKDFGGGVFYLAATVMSDLIHKDPTCFSVLDAAGLPSAFVDSIIDGVLCSSEAISCIPQCLDALCLNNSGLQAVKDRNALSCFVKIFTSRSYLRALAADTPAALSSGLDELMRHASSLRAAGVDMLIEILNTILKLGSGTEAPSSSSAASLSSPVPMDTDAEDKNSSSPFDKEQLQKTERLDPGEPSPDTFGNVVSFIPDCVNNVARLLETILQNSDACCMFIERRGIESVLQIFTLPLLPLSFSVGQSIAIAFKNFSPQHSASLAKAVCSFLKEHLGTINELLNSVAGVRLADVEAAKQTSFLRCLSSLEGILSLSNSLLKGTTPVISELGSGDADVLKDIGVVYKEVMWQMSLSCDPKVEEKQNGEAETDSAELASMGGGRESDDDTPVLRYMNPVSLRSGSQSQWGGGRDFLRVIRSSEGLSRRSRHSLARIRGGRTGRHLDALNTDSDAAANIQDNSSSQEFKKKSPDALVNEVLSKLASTMRSFFTAIVKGFTSSNRRRSDPGSLGSAAKNIGAGLAKVFLEALSFSGHSSSVGLDISLSTKCRYLGKVVDDVASLTFDNRRRVSYTAMVNNFYVIGAFKELLTTFEATSQLLWTMPISTQTSGMEAEKASKGGKISQNSWLLDTLQSYCRVLEYFVNSSLLLSQTSTAQTQMLVQPVAVGLSIGLFPVPGDPEVFVRMLQSQVLDVILPVWNHPSFPISNPAFVTSILSLINHVYSGVGEVKRNQAGVAGSTNLRVAPPPDEATIATIVEMGFSRARAEEALRRVESNSVEMAMEWLCNHADDPVQDDDDLARALALSLGNSTEASKADNVDKTGDILNDEGKMRTLPIDDIIGTSMKLFQTSDSMAFPLTDLLVTLCNRSKGEDRPKVASFLIHQMKLCPSDFTKDTDSLSTIAHILALLLSEDSGTREVAVKNGIISVAIDILTVFKAKNESGSEILSTKCVTALLLILDNLLESKPKISSESMVGTPNGPLPDSSIDEKQASDGKETGLAVEKLMGQSIGYLSVEERVRVLAIVCDLLKQCVPSVIMQAVFHLCARLTKTHDLAMQFLECGGMAALFSLPRSSFFPGYDTLASAIVRHLLEDPQTLQTAMELEIRHALSGSRHSGRIPTRTFLTSMAPVISRDPAIFMKASMGVCQLESAGGRTVIVLSKDKDKEKERGKSSAVEAVLPSNDSLRIPEMKAHDGTGKCSKGHKKVPTNLTQVLDQLLEIVLQFPAAKDQEDFSSYETAMEVDEPATKVKGKTKIGETKKPESDDLPERSSAIARVVFVLKLLSDVLLMYVHAMGVVLRWDSELCQLQGACHLDAPGNGGIVHHVLHRILPFSADEYAAPTELRDKLSEKASWFLVVLCGRSGEGRRRVINELVKALSLYSNPGSNSEKSSLFPDRKVLALAELVHSILSKHSSTGSSPVSGYSPDMAKSMIDGGIIPCLTNILQVMDLDHPDAPKTANLILKALECLSRAANASESAFKSDGLNKNKSTDSQGRPGEENLTVNGTMEHQNRGSGQNAEDAVGNEGHNAEEARLPESVNGVISDTSLEQVMRINRDGNSATDDAVGLGVGFMREDVEGGAVMHNADPINVNLDVENRHDDDIVDEGDDMGDGDEEEDEDEGDDEDEDIVEDGAALISLVDSDVDDHEHTGLGDEYNDDMVDEDEDDDDYHDNRVIEVRWRGVLDGFDHLQVLGQSGSGVIDVAGETFEGVNVDDLFGLRRPLGFERRRQATRPSFNRINTEGRFQHPLLARPSQSGDMGYLRPSGSRVSRDSESLASGSFDMAQFYMFDAPGLPYDHRPSSLYGDRLGAPAPPPLTEFQLAVRRGPGDGRWADDGQPQLGAQASTIAQMVEQLFVSHLRSNDPAHTLVARQSRDTMNEVNQQSGVPESNGNLPESASHGLDSQHREVHQENHNEAEHQQSSPQHEDASAREHVNSEPVAHDGIQLDDHSSVNLDVPDNAEHDPMEIRAGNGISSGTFQEGISPSPNTLDTSQHEGTPQMVTYDHGVQMMAPDATGPAGNDSHPGNHLTVESGLMMSQQVDHQASSVGAEMNTATELIETEQAMPSSHSAVAEDLYRGNTSVAENANQSDHTASTDQVPGPNAIDPTFLEALPEDLRAEVLASQQSQSVQPSAYTPPSVEDIDPEFLAALPSDIQAEVLAQQRAQRIAQQSEGQPVDMDNATIIATLPADLREEVLLTSSESVLSALPSPLLAEARMLRDRALSHYQARSLLGSSHRLGSRRNGLGFDQHSVVNRGVGMTIGRRAVSSLGDHAKVKEIEGDPLLDANALKALIRLLRLAQPLGKGLLHRLLLNLSAHSATRTILVHLLLDMIRPEAEGMIGGLSIVNSQRLYGCPSNVVYGRSQLLDGVPPLVLRRVLEVLTYLATNHSSVANILFYFDPSVLGESYSQEYPECKSDKGKGKIESGDSLTGNSGEGNVPLILLLKLLRRPLFLRSSAHLDQLMDLLQVVVYTAASELENQSLPGPAVDLQDPDINKASDHVQKESPSADSESQRDSKDADQKSGGSAESFNSQGNKSNDIFTTFAHLPQSDLRNLCLLLGHEGLSDKVYMLVGEVLKKFASMASPHREFFTLELADLAQVLSSSAVGELVTLKNTHMMGLSAGSMAGAAMLRVLQTLSCLVSLRGPEGLEELQDRVIIQKLNSALEPLWRELSECIGTTEIQLGQSSLSPTVSTLSAVENVEGSSHSSAPLPPGTQRLLPFIEAFFVLCEKLQSSNSITLQDHDDFTVTDAKESTSRPSSDLTSDGGPQMRLNATITFSNFVEKHRRLLNAFIRQNAGLLEKSLSMMLKAPRLIDFDNKRAHFRSKIRQQHDQHLIGPLRISVRRAYVLEDSYNQLRLRPTQDLRGRLNVQFQGEEGIDAGGLTREWYQLLSRVIFDKGALLFTTVGNNATFQPNPNSDYQTEHLSYFKFVGRVVAKALFDGQLLDVYFTRSFYKHILGFKVTYHDIEAVDPDYYKNLKWMLENDVSDLPDLTFSMDPDEEKHILYEKTEVTDYELKPGGRNIRVTEETKHEYVDLVADHILTNAIRPQINSFLEGFNELVPKELISIFNDKELELLISGLPEIDLDDLKMNTEYTGYTAASNVVQWFWEVVGAFSKEDMARLLQFVTGTSKVPLEGFKALQGISGPQKFQVHKAYGEPERLPSAHTCFNQLDMPEYTSKEQLQERLLLAIHEASEGFGFG